MIRRFTAIALIISVTWVTTWTGNPALGQQAASITDQNPEALEEFDQYFELIEELRSHLDRSQFELGALVESLDYDAELIATFVSEEIRFEPYRGLLRGAKGTLLSRAGNALDQSVLLATLLKDAGLEARIARRRISEQQAIELIRQPIKSRNDLRVFADLPSTEALVSSISDLIGHPKTSPNETDKALEAAARKAQEMEEQIDRETRFILDLLEARDISIGGGETDSQIIEDTKDYFYVEYRDRASGPWIQLHPVAPNADMFSNGKPLEIFLEEIPEELQHRFRVSVFVEQSLGNRTIDHAILPLWERPTANLIGRTLTFANTSSTAQTLGDAFSPAPEKLQQGIFIPTFGGLPVTGGLAFDHRGFAVPIDALQMDSMGALQLFQTVSEKAGSAVDALSSIGSTATTSSSAKLRAVRMEYAITSPGGAESEYTRYLVNRNVGKAADDSDGSTSSDDEAWLLQLLDLVEIVVAVGEYPEAYLIDRTLQRIVESAGAIRKIQETYSGSLTDLPIEILSDLASFERGQDVLWAALTSPTERDSPLYRSEPNVMAVRTGFRLDGSSHQGFIETDILNNERRTLVHPDTPGDSVRRQIRSGVRDTHLERVLAGGPTGSPEAARITSAFHQARDAGLEPLVLLPEEDARADRLDIPEALRSYVQEDLQRGNIVILPASKWTSETELAWWRIDPITGTTLGIGAEGKGIAATEYLIAMIVIAAFVAVLAGGVTYKTCMDRPEGEAYCCVLDAVMYGGIGFGATVVGLFASTGYAVFMALIGNPGQWFASAMNWTPSWCCGFNPAIPTDPLGLRPGVPLPVTLPGYCD